MGRTKKKVETSFALQSRFNPGHSRGQRRPKYFKLLSGFNPATAATISDAIPAFQSRRARCGRRRTGSDSGQQSTPPHVGGDALTPAPSATASSFQSMPPRGIVLLLAIVSIHAPARGATTQARESRLRVVRFQSTPPRGGRPALTRAVHPRHAVSIHAPARGATDDPPIVAAGQSRFNPRPRAGGDLSGHRADVAALVVSIHAPARGATA